MLFTTLISLGPDWYQALANSGWIGSLRLPVTAYHRMVASDDRPPKAYFYSPIVFTEK